MRLRTLFSCCLVAVVGILLLTGCQGPTGAGTTATAGNESFENPVVIPDDELARESNIDFPAHCGNYVIKVLYGGQTIDVGWVAVWNDETNLYVHYRTRLGWVLTETHLAVANTLFDIPHNKAGNPQVGLFPYKGEYDPPETDIRYTIPLQWYPGKMLYIAAHSVVLLVDQYGQTIQQETAWGDGCCPEPNKKGNWAMFFTYNVQACP
jgi:hypothetical protein